MTGPTTTRLCSRRSQHRMCLLIRLQELLLQLDQSALPLPLGQGGLTIACCLQGAEVGDGKGKERDSVGVERFVHVCVHCAGELLGVRCKQVDPPPHTHTHTHTHLANTVLHTRLFHIYALLTFARVGVVVWWGRRKGGGGEGGKGEKEEGYLICSRAFVLG